ncbi:hypothetical protein DFH09DRAFT_1279043 [Mycena vulgaris]|nr:hypothetical protein DFH09DRAFT_1279043 [Mycena vulgaris]
MTGTRGHTYKNYQRQKNPRSGATRGCQTRPRRAPGCHRYHWPQTPPSAEGRPAHRAHVQTRAAHLRGPSSAGYALVPEEKQAEEEEGAICYVAPTILDLLRRDRRYAQGVPKFEEMTSRSLLVRVEKN